jgi:hypothetical protein
MERSEMLSLFEAHREAEAARDIDGILNTFVPDRFLETMALGLRSEGRDAVRAAYQMQFFSAFPDLAPPIKGWRSETTPSSCGARYAEPAPGTGSESLLAEARSSCPFANVVPFRDGLMPGEIIYFDLATLCEQAEIPLGAVRAAAAARGR